MCKRVWVSTIIRCQNTDYFSLRFSTKFVFFRVYMTICIRFKLSNITPYIFESKYNSSTLYQYVMGCLRLQLYAMIWDITYSKICNIISRISEFIGHESTPPSRIEISLTCLTLTHVIS